MLCIQRVEEGRGRRAAGPLSPFDLGWLCLGVHCFSMNVCSDDLFQMMVYMMISYCLPSLDLQDELCFSNQNGIPALRSPCRRSRVLLL